MVYRIVGTGPRLAAPHVRQASTAAEALLLLGSVRRLCGRVVVQDEGGSEVSDADLRRAETKERRSGRRRPPLTRP